MGVGGGMSKEEEGEEAIRGLMFSVVELTY